MLQDLRHDNRISAAHQMYLVEIQKGPSGPRPTRGFSAGKRVL